MKIIRTYKVELKPTKQQTEKLFQFAGCVRFVYNWALARKIEAYKNDKTTLRQRELQPELQRELRIQHPWLTDAPATALLAALQNNDRAFTAFFRRLKKGETPGFPRFKSKHKDIGGFKFFNKTRVVGRHIYLPKLGAVKLKEKGYLPEGTLPVISGSVKYRCGRWFVTVGLEVEHTVPSVIPDLVLGVDMGVTSTAVISDGKIFVGNKHLQNNLKRLARYNRKLHRQKKGSKKRNKTKRILARLHYRVACQRQHDLHGISHYITAKTKPSVIVLEDLNVSGMLKNRSLSRQIAERSFGELRRQIEYKAAWYGNDVVIADRWYPSSKTCFNCKITIEKLSLSQRTFQCPSCNHTEDRDLNAAKNLAAYGSSVKHTGNHSEINAQGENWFREKLQPVVVS